MASFLCFWVAIFEAQQAITHYSSCSSNKAVWSLPYSYRAEQFLTDSFFDFVFVDTLMRFLVVWLLVVYAYENFAVFVSYFLELLFSCFQ